MIRPQLPLKLSPSPQTYPEHRDLFALGGEENAASARKKSDVRWPHWIKQPFFNGSLLFLRHEPNQIVAAAHCSYCT